MQCRDAKQLVKEIEAFAEANGLAVSTVCRRAHGDARLVDRLNNGARIWDETAAKVRAWLSDNKNSRKNKQRRTA